MESRAATPRRPSQAALLRVLPWVVCVAALIPHRVAGDTIDTHTDLYVVGDFVNINDNNVKANGVAKWDGSTWTAVGVSAVPGTSPGPGTGDPPVGGSMRAAAMLPGGILTVGGTAAPYLAQANTLDGSTWTTAVGDGFDGAVNALATLGGVLVAGGNFSAPAPYLAKRVDGAWVPIMVAGAAPPSAVTALLAADDGTLYMTGSFGVWSWNGTAATTLLAAFVSGSGKQLLMASTGLLVAGDFAASIPAFSTDVFGLIAWSGSAWSVPYSGISATLNGIDVLDGYLYTADTVAHTWTSSGGWTQLLTNAKNVNGVALAVARYQGSVAFAGDFTYSGGSPSAHLALWDPTASAWAASPFLGGVDGPVNVLLRACQPAWAGSDCTLCAAGHYGSSCAPCVGCVAGCSDGLLGTGACNPLPTTSAPTTPAPTTPAPTTPAPTTPVPTTSAPTSTPPSNCNAVGSGYYSTLCTPCPACVHGTCDDGAAGTGHCICAVGYAGTLCNRVCDPLVGDICPTATPTNAVLTACAANQYGPSCTACPACGAHGTCNDTRSGDGTCTCTQGWAGTLCDACAPGYYGSACASCPSCGAHGACNDGLGGVGCVCAPGWSGSQCAQCASGYYGAACTACPSCGTHGACNDTAAGDGACACATGWAGAACDVCAAGYFGAACSACPACVHGICNDTLAGSGVCVCEAGWAGGVCAACAPDYYGANCTACAACNASGHGTCTDGLDGACVCADYFMGPTCATLNIAVVGYTLAILADHLNVQATVIDALSTNLTAQTAQLQNMQAANSALQASASASQTELFAAIIVASVAAALALAAGTVAIVACRRTR